MVEKKKTTTSLTLYLDRYGSTSAKNLYKMRTGLCPEYEYIDIDIFLKKYLLSLRFTEK